MAFLLKAVAVVYLTSQNAVKNVGAILLYESWLYVDIDGSAILPDGYDVSMGYRFFKVEK